MRGDILDERRLRYLFEATRRGSVRAAADALDVNPSVVSRQIAQLEQDVGAALIERLSRGVRATEAGALLAESFRRWSIDREDALAKLADLRELRRGHIDIVAGEGFVSDLMSGALDLFWRRHPAITLALDLAGTDEVVRAVAEDRCHLGLVYNAPADPRIKIAVASRQPIRLIARPDHPLAHGAVSLRQIAEHPLGLMSPGYGARQIVSAAEALESMQLSPRMTTGSIAAMRQFVKAGLGVSLLPAFAVAGDVEDGSLVAAPIDNPALAAAQAQVILRAGRQASAAAAALLRVLTAHLRALRSEPAGSAAFA